MHKYLKRVPRCHSGLRVQRCHHCGSGHMFDPWLWNFQMPWVRPKKKKKFKWIRRFKDLKQLVKQRLALGRGRDVGAGGRSHACTWEAQSGPSVDPGTAQWGSDLEGWSWCDRNSFAFRSRTTLRKNCLLPRRWESTTRVSLAKRKCFHVRGESMVETLSELAPQMTPAPALQACPVPRVICAKLSHHHANGC